MFLFHYLDGLFLSLNFGGGYLVFTTLHSVLCVSITLSHRASGHQQRNTGRVVVGSGLHRVMGVAEV
jgi:hypothetical protein